MSNAPTVLFGSVPLFRTVVRSATSDTATTVTPDDSGTLFVSLATATHTYTLPTVANSKCKVFTFFAGDGTATIVVTGGTTDVMMGGDNAAADTETETNHVVGDWGMIVGDGTYYYFLEGLAHAGAWDASG